MGFVVLDTVIVPAVEVTAEHDEPGTHVVVAVRHDRAALLQAEDLAAENDAADAFHLTEVEADARGPVVRQRLAGDLGEVEQLHQLGQVGLLV